MHLGEALTKVGLIGVKVWICKGEIFGKRDLAPNIGAKSAKPKAKFQKTQKVNIACYKR